MFEMLAIVQLGALAWILPTLLFGLMQAYGLKQQNKMGKQEYELGKMGLDMQDAQKKAELEANKELNLQKQSMSDKYMKEASRESMRDRSAARAARTQDRVMQSQNQQAAMMMSMMQGLGDAQPSMDMRYISQLLQ